MYSVRKKWKSEAPAQANIGREVARGVVDLVTQEGPQLERTLRALGIVQDAGPGSAKLVDIDKVEEYVSKHCVVMSGHMPKVYWPRVHRSSGNMNAVLLCTCEWFVQHAICEHVCFVGALRDEPINSCMERAPALGLLPTERKRGRKRKHQDPSAVPAQQENNTMSRRPVLESEPGLCGKDSVVRHACVSKDVSDSRGVWIVPVSGWGQCECWKWSAKFWE